MRKDYPVRVPKALLKKIKGDAKRNARTLAAQVGLMIEGGCRRDGEVAEKYQGKADSWIGVPIKLAPALKAAAARHGRTVGGQLVWLLS